MAVQDLSALNTLATESRYWVKNKQAAESYLDKLYFRESPKRTHSRQVHVLRSHVQSCRVA